MTSSTETGWRIVRTYPVTFAPVTYWAYDFDDAIKTIVIIGGNPRDYTIQRQSGDGKSWIDTGHALSGS